MCPSRIRHSSCAVCGALLVVLTGATAWAVLPTDPAGEAPHPDGIHVVDGSYVITVGQLQVNITNHGLIGSQFTQTFPYSDAPSGQWPAGSGDEYLWGGGLWVGGKVNNEIRVSTGQPEREFRPTRDLWSTMYEARNNVVVRPGGNPHTSGFRVPDANADDDHDGAIDEETLNGEDDDRDGLVDEDFGQIGDQMIVCTMYDNTRLASELYSDHDPLGLEIVQTATAFSADHYSGFVALTFRITNIGTTDIEELYPGFLADCDVGRRGNADLGRDDLTGHFQGLVRSSNSTWAQINVGYMHDGDDEDPLSGYFGVVGLGNSRFRGYHHFAGNRTYEAGGLPIEDRQRYDVLSRYGVDRWEGLEPYDYSFLMTGRRYAVLPPGGSLDFEIALVVGDGLEELLTNCANAHMAFDGAYFDLDGDQTTGTYGRESKDCFEEIPPPGSHYYERSAFLMQDWCSGGPGNFPLITEQDFFQDESGLWCIWVNNDNCIECSNRSGVPCDNDVYLFWEHWNCAREFLSPAERIGCTGIAGRETRVPWFDTRVPPPAPGIRVWPRDNAVHVFWNDLSEHMPDFELELIDFESYRVWRADNWDRPRGTSTRTGPGSNLWQLIAEYDLVNEMEVPTGNGSVDTVALGANTGLAGIAYRPVCLDDPRFAGLEAAMQEIIDADVEGRLTRRPLLRDGTGRPDPDYLPLLRWESHPDVLDTFFMVAARPGAEGVRPKRGERFYEYVDQEVHNGFLYYYSVTATDRRIEVIDSRPINRGYGLVGSPNAAFMHTSPATPAQTAAERQRYGTNIYVYPNPATIDALAEFQQYHPARNDPTGVRIAFANLPAAHNRISICTAAGDLVKTLYHDGTDGYGQATWDLVSDNGQEIVSGIYLYAVQSDDPAFADFAGKFVVVR